MKEIKLTQGKVSVVSDADYAYLSQWKWDAHYDNGNWYARRIEEAADGRKEIKMHRVIMDIPDGVQVDHKDGNGLHNWRENLRPATHAQNQQNRRIGSNNTTGFKGVVFRSQRKSPKKFQAYIKSNGKFIHIGYYADVVEAAHAYDIKAVELFGEFAKTNF